MIVGDQRDQNTGPKRNERVRGLLKKSPAHAVVIQLATPVGQSQLPGFELPTEDESDADANERRLFRLLLHIVTRVALQIAEDTTFHFASGLSHGTFRLTLGVLPNTIWSGG